VEYDARHQGEYETRQAAHIRETFIGAEVEMLENLLLMDVPEDAKKSELIKIIDSVSKETPNQLVLIFTEYLETQVFLVKLLENVYGDGCTVIIRGGMSLWEKKQSMAAFRDNPLVRFLVSTEAGGEGINLQFAHVMINYDLPWNPFRLAQRYGRLYRYGQDRRVQVFNFQNAGTIEDRVQGYLETKARLAANRLVKVTGETVEEIEEGLLGLFEEYLDYERIYREGLARGNIKSSQKEIDEGIRKAEQAYQIAYSSLFSKDIAPFNPSRFKHEIQSPLTLADVEAFILEYVKREGRKVTKVNDGTIEFLLPEYFKAERGLKKRYSKVTFDRNYAIRHSEIDFMALGHPFTDAVIQRCGSVEFGGLSSFRIIKCPDFAGCSGVLFNFIVKITKATSDNESIFFELVPIFVEKNCVINDTAAKVALYCFSESKPEHQKIPLAEELYSYYECALRVVLNRYAEQQLWNEDVMCLNAAITEFH
jgi:hypothetical protein